MSEKCERKRGIKDDSEDFGPSNWMNADVLRTERHRSRWGWVEIKFPVLDILNLHAYQKCESRLA